MESEGEIVVLTDTHAVIDIRGGEFDSALLVQGKPIALNWSDCEGSVAQYMARAGATNYEENLGSLRHLLDDALRSDVALRPQIDYFLQLFVPGRYRLTYHEDCPEWDYAEFSTNWSTAKEYDHVYPYGWLLVFTQPTDGLNQEQVHKYLHAIESGQRPVALTGTVKDGWCEFVLDGHHKLRAYKAAGVNPSFVSVCRLNAPRLSSDSFDGYIGNEHPMAGHYHRVKTEYDV